MGIRTSSFVRLTRTYIFTVRHGTGMPRGCGLVHAFLTAVIAVISGYYKCHFMPAPYRQTLSFPRVPLKWGRYCTLKTFILCITGPYSLVDTILHSFGTLESLELISTRYLISFSVCIMGLVAFHCSFSDCHFRLEQILDSTILLICISYKFSRTFLPFKFLSLHGRLVGTRAACTVLCVTAGTAFCLSFCLFRFTSLLNSFISIESSITNATPIFSSHMQYKVIA